MNKHATHQDYDDDDNADESWKLQAAVDDILDLIVRPPGTLDAHLPQTPEASRALMGLFDAMGRTP